MSRLRRPFRKGSKGALLQNRKGTTLRQDLGKGAADIKTAFKKIKDAGKSLTRGTKDLTATRFGVIQGPAAGSDLLVAAKKIASKKDDGPQFTKKSRLELRKEAKAEREAKAGEANKTSGVGTANRGSANEKARAAAKRREAWEAKRPKASDFKGSGRRLTPSQRAEFNKALKAWRASKPK
jgi:peptidoglycan hydrolase CwlO-like protein